MSWLQGRRDSLIHADTRSAGRNTDRGRTAEDHRGAGAKIAACMPDNLHGRHYWQAQVG